LSGLSTVSNNWATIFLLLTSGRIGGMVETLGVVFDGGKPGLLDNEFVTA